jgi:glycerol-3-phosphate dehydrogenase (NAD(P)+)
MAAMGRSDRPEVRFGRALADGATTISARNSVGLRIEAVDLVPRVVEFAKQHGLVVPVFTALAEVIAGRASKETVLPALMAPGRSSSKK